jgi:four helix bundle protein
MITGRVERVRGRKYHASHRAMVLGPSTVTSLHVVNSYQDLIVWKKAIALVLETYRLTKAFPEDECFGLTVQIRRAAISIASNIAEGHGRHHTADFCRFLSMARGSVKEVESDLVIAEGLGFLTAKDLGHARSLSDEIRRMLSGLQRRLRRTPTKPARANSRLR